MTYSFTPPEGRACGWRPICETVALSLPADTPLAVPSDPARWERRNGRIVASYTWEELRVAVGLALEQKREALETRLERGLDLMRAAAGCDDAEAERLLEHWDSLVRQYGDLLSRIEQV
jgi:hypothetical protein